MIGFHVTFAGEFHSRTEVARIPPRHAGPFRDPVNPRQLLDAANLGKVDTQRLKAALQDLEQLKARSDKRHLKLDSLRAELKRIRERSDAKANAVKVPTGPPRVIEQFVWMLLPRKNREAILGDAAEAYAETLRRYGRRWATWDYCKEVVFAITGSLRMQAGRWIGWIRPHLR